jgi:hypothetical protein
MQYFRRRAAILPRVSTDPVFQNEASGRLAKAKASRRGPMPADPREIIYGKNWNMIYIWYIPMITIDYGIYLLYIIVLPIIYHSYTIYAIHL